MPRKYIKRGLNYAKSKIKRKPKVITVRTAEQHEKRERAKKVLKAVGKHTLKVAAGGAVLGAGTAAAIAPKGRRKKAAKRGAAWGTIGGIPAGIIVGAHARGKGKKKTKKRRKR